MTTDPPIATGPTGDLASWFAEPPLGGPLLPTTQSITGGIIRLRSTAWTGPPAVTSLTYLGPPPNYTTAAGAILQPFTLPIPYP